MLVSGAKRVRPRNGTLDIVCTDENIIRIFEITGLDRIFGIYPTRDEALKAAGSPDVRTSLPPRPGERSWGRTWSYAALNASRTQPPHWLDDMLKTKTYGTGRICVVDGCGTTPFGVQPRRASAPCTAAPGSDDFHRAARKASQREEITRRCAFEPCGREFTTTNPAKKYCSDACRMKAFQARVMAAAPPGRRRTSIRRAS